MDDEKRFTVRLQEAQADLQSLERVFHRLALTEAGEPLEKVLTLLLPRLLARIGSNHQLSMKVKRNEVALKQSYDRIHKKIIEMIGHVMKRVRADSNLKLPCESILKLLCDEKEKAISSFASVDPFTLNLSLSFLTIGINRCDKSEALNLFSGFLCLLGFYTQTSTPAKKLQCFQVAHLVLRCLEVLVSKEEMKQNSNSLNENEIQKIRSLVYENPNIARELFDLLLDGLLFTPPSNTSQTGVPSFGLSKNSYDRLLSGNSPTSKTWINEFSSSTRLKKFKLNLLELIAPTRLWSIFFPADKDYRQNRKGISRTLVLLVISSGDKDIDVSNQALDYLKSYLDTSLRKSTESTRADKDIFNGKSEAKNSYLGCPITLTVCLLSLVTGDSASNKVLIESNTQVYLGRNLAKLQPNSAKEWFRRMVADKTITVILNFLTTRIFEGIPQFFSLDFGIEVVVSNSQFSTNFSSASIIGNLAIATANYCMNSASGGVIVASGTTNNSRSINPKIAFAQMLNSLCIQLTKIYDELCKNTETSFHEVQILKATLSNILSTSFSGLSVASSTTSHNSVLANDIDVRNAYYGILCTISRSNFALAPEAILFSGFGNVDVSSNEKNCLAQLETSQISTTSTAQLFNCISNEVETLRPRAVAALDALLSAFLKVYDQVEKQPLQSNEDHDKIIETVSNNPWASLEKEKISETSLPTSPWINLTSSLIPLLWSAVRPTQIKSSRFAATRWTSEFLKKIDLVSAIHLLCFLCGDTDVSISKLARESLGVSKTLPSSGFNRERDIVFDEIDEEINAIELKEIIIRLFGKYAELNKSLTLRPTYKNFSPVGKGASLRFILNCLFTDLYSVDVSNMEYFIMVLLETLQQLHDKFEKGETFEKDNIDLLEECSYCLASCIASSKSLKRTLINTESTFNYKALISLTLRSGSSLARRLLANVLSFLYEDPDLWISEDGKSVYNLLDPMASCIPKLKEIDEHVRNSGEVHGSIYLASICIRTMRVTSENHFVKKHLTKETRCYELSRLIVSYIGNGLLHTNETIANSCADGINIAFSYDSLDSPSLDRHFFDGTAEVLRKVITGLKKFGNGDNADATRASYLVQAAGSVLAASTTASGIHDDSNIADNIGNARLDCVEALFSLLGGAASKKDPVIDLQIGEALVTYADAYSPVGVEWSENTLKKNDSALYIRSLPPHRQVIFQLLEKEIKAASPLKRNACCPVLLAVVGHTAKLVNINETFKHRLFVKEVFQYLPEFQKVFVKMLTDSKIKQISRESCCLGLAACHGIARIYGNFGTELNDRLLNAFGQTTNHGRSVLMESREQEANRRTTDNESNAASLTENFGIETTTEVGGVAGMGESALNSFREMSATALFLGRPDILYLLMILSVSDPIWSLPSTKYKYNATSLLGCAKGGSGSMIKEVREVIRPHLSSLIPRLLRACHDPNKQTREQMSNIWHSLAGNALESRELISKYFTGTLDELLTEAASKLWRARMGAIGALNSIVIGRSWFELGGGGPVTNDDDLNEKANQSKNAGAVRLLLLWRITMRGLDDVRSNVREASENLSRTLSSLTIRLCDPASVNEVKERDSFNLNKQNIDNNSSAAASSSLWWLMRFGLNQPCAEATTAAISCLLGIVDVAKPATLQSSLPNLIGSLTLAISGLEPSVLSTLHVRAAGQSANSSDRIERIRLQIAQTSPINSALVKCLEMVKHTPLEVQRKIIPELDNAIRSGAGGSTRAAAADSVNHLCNSCPLAFKFSGNLNTNPTVRLLRALYFATEKERGAAVQERMALTLGSLAALAPGASVRSLAKKACDKYIAHTGSNDDPHTRKVAVLVLRSIAVRASEQFSDGGKYNIWCEYVLPIAYLGIKDKDEKVSSLWKEIWDEGGSSAVLSRKRKGFDYEGVILLEERLLSQIVSISIEALNDVVWARRLTACAALGNLVDLNILSPILNMIDGTAQSIRKKRRTQGSSAALSSCIRLILRTRLWTGKSEVVKTMVKLAKKWLFFDDNRPNFSLEVYGWTEEDDCNNKFCPWVPVCMEVKSRNDLFIGDDWFLHEMKGNSENEEYNDVIGKITENVPNTSEAYDENADKIDDSITEEMEDMEQSIVKQLDRISANLESVTLSGLCRLLLKHSQIESAPLDSELLPYRATCLQGLSTLLIELQNSARSSTQQEEATKFKRALFPHIHVIVKDFFNETNKENQPPLIIARGIESLGSCFWQGIGEKEEDGVKNVCEMLRYACGSTQPAWKVREASLLACSLLIKRMASCSLKKHETIKLFVECAIQSSKDRKFWQVRKAGLELLNGLVSRGESNRADTVLESILPFKERILRLAKSSLADNEANVTVVASKICSAMSWWP